MGCDCQLLIKENDDDDEQSLQKPPTTFKLNRNVTRNADSTHVSQWAVMSMTVYFICVESLFLFTSKSTLEVVAMDAPLDVTAMKIVYLQPPIGCLSSSSR